MATDRFDTVAVAGFLGVAVAASASLLEGTTLAAALGGFVLSLAVWRLYDGRPWEAFAWALWTVSAVAMVVLPADDPIFVVAFYGPLLAGLGLLVVARTGLAVGGNRVGPHSE